MNRRRLTPCALVPVAAVALLATAPAALSATAPVVNDPTPASLTQGRPHFTWTNGPAGEQPRGIFVRTTADVDSRGYPTGPFAARVPTTGDIRRGATSIRADTGLLAGTYYWSFWWVDPADQSQTAQFSPMRRFAIPARLSTVRITSVGRGTGGGSVTIGGRSGAGARPSAYNITLLARVGTNAGSFTGTCRILNGRRVVSAQVVRPVSQDPTALNPTGCQLLRIPARLAGTRLKATFTVRAAGKTRTAQRWFVIR